MKIRKTKAYRQVLMAIAFVILTIIHKSYTDSIKNACPITIKSGTGIFTIPS